MSFLPVYVLESVLYATPGCSYYLYTTNTTNRQMQVQKNVQMSTKYQKLKT